MKKLLSLLLSLLLLAGLCACDAGQILDAADTVLAVAEAVSDAAPAEPAAQTAAAAQAADAVPDENGVYTSKEDVALYLHLYGRLPANFITKTKARALGWDGGSLEDYAPGMCIGGGGFGNNEGLLPEAPGISYYECDIDTLGADSRGAKRLVWSSDGYIYYTEDHYESFELLYTPED